MTPNKVSLSEPSPSDKAEEAVLPCPFCGCAPRFLPMKAGFYEERVICDECHFHIAAGYEKSIAPWNRRVIRPECGTLSGATPPMPRDDEIRLAMGELTPDQMRTAKAAIRWALNRTVSARQERK